MSSTTKVHPTDFGVMPLTTWADLRGNSLAMRAVQRVLFDPDCPSKLMICGPSGSGKSTVANHGCKLAACYEPAGDEPCNSCKGCRTFYPGKDHCGTFAAADFDQPEPFHYLPINCRNITAARIHDLLDSIRFVDGVRVVHIEEAAGLKKLACDESITDLMDSPDFATCRWIATCVKDHGLDQQFRRRWIFKVKTSPPSLDALINLLAHRCDVTGIDVDDAATLRLLAKRSWRVVGLAMAALAQSYIEVKPRLTKENVLAYPFPQNDPWQDKFYES